MVPAVLVIDDEAKLAQNIKSYLDKRGYDVQVAPDGREGLAALESFRPDIILLDFQMSGMNGLEVLKQIRLSEANVKVIIVTGHGGIQLAVDAMKAGAYDYLTKPLALGELKILLDRAAGQNRVEGALAYYHKQVASRGGLAKLIGESPPMRDLKNQVRRLIAAESRMTGGAAPAVLVTGETGTGKELIARAFHFEGKRREKPFVEINCATLPSDLMEAELFGFERGAFTGAQQRKVGLIETAHQGTLFLDEIGELDLRLQAKLLRVLEDGVVRRLGSVRENKVDIRIVAATNQVLENCVATGDFRDDLYFRLRMMQVELPPLHDRGRDILLLAKTFLETCARRYHQAELYLSPSAERALMNHSWPGNVRELRNTIERAVLLACGSIIGPDDLALTKVKRLDGNGNGMAPVEILPDKGLKLEELESVLVSQALEKTGGNVTRAAKLLGISRDTMRYRIDKHGFAKLD